MVAMFRLIFLRHFYPIQKLPEVTAVALLFIFAGACIGCSLTDQFMDSTADDEQRFAFQDGSNRIEDAPADAQYKDKPYFEVNVNQESPPALCTDIEQIHFITDFDVYQTPQLAEPEPRQPFRDPIFGTCLVRVTDRKSDLSPDDISAGLKNEYSRVSVVQCGWQPDPGARY
jgi:hypothetical protein